MIKRVGRLVLAGETSRSEALLSLVNLKALRTLDSTGTIPGIEMIVDACEKVGIYESHYDSEVVQNNPQNELYDNAYPYKKLVGARTHQRRAFRTINGLLGLGPRIIKPGDVIAIIPSVKTPLILRKETEASDAYYQLLDEAYVHGVMHGEALEDGTRWTDVILV